MNFKSWDEAQEAFEEELGVLSDDVESEESRFMNWLENNGHRVFEDDPLGEVDRENAKPIERVNF